MTNRTRKFVSNIIIRTLAFMLIGDVVLAITVCCYWAYVGLLLLLLRS